MTYVTADYAPDFACKCGDCRHNCCGGWPVTISRAEYERIMAADCPPDYREELKSVLRRNYAPDDERYAHIVHDDHGKCILLTAEGLCGMQLKLGEAALPAVCRLYPRNRRCVSGRNECALSFSCEAVTEKLLSDTAPLRLIKTEIAEAPLFPIELTEAQLEDCRRAVAIIQDRSMPLESRMERLGSELFGCTEPCTSEDAPQDAMRLLHELCVENSGRTKPAGPCCIEALRLYGVTNPDKLSAGEAQMLLERYEIARKQVFASRPDWEDKAERLIVNHMFYNNFPHVGGTNDGVRGFYALCAMFAFTKFVFTAGVYRSEDENAAADTLSELGRLIEHSDFKYRAAQYYRRHTDYSPGYWRVLIGL